MVQAPLPMFKLFGPSRRAPEGEIKKDRAQNNQESGNWDTQPQCWRTSG